MNKDLMDFKDRLATDAEFFKKLKDYESAEEIVRFAAEEGYSFTEEELLEETELSDAELASAAGGLGIGISGGETDYAGIVGF